MPIPKSTSKPRVVEIKKDKQFIGTNKKGTFKAYKEYQKAKNKQTKI